MAQSSQPRDETKLSATKHPQQSVSTGAEGKRATSIDISRGRGGTRGRYSRGRWHSAHRHVNGLLLVTSPSPGPIRGQQDNGSPLVSCSETRQ